MTHLSSPKLLGVTSYTSRRRSAHFARERVCICSVRKNKRNLGSNTFSFGQKTLLVRHKLSSASDMTDFLTSPFPPRQIFDHDFPLLTFPSIAEHICFLTSNNNALATYDCFSNCVARTQTIHSLTQTNLDFLLPPKYYPANY